MALSVADYIAWDFTKASTPLTSIAGQSESFSLVGGATVDTTNGIRLATTADYADLACTNGGDLVGWAYPYTFVFVGRRTSTAGTNFQQALLLRTTPQIGLRIVPNSVTNCVQLQNGSTYSRAPASNPSAGSTFIAILEVRANGATLWQDNVSIFADTTATLTMPTLSTGDVIRFGASTAVLMDCDMFGAALVPGALTAQDRTDIQTDWRAAFALGPTITVQPANDVGIISNGQSTVYTTTATGTTISNLVWREDGSTIGHGGIYNIVTTGIGTGSVTSTLTITRTSKTNTPWDIRASVTDANGTTETNTVTDTWWTGPVLTTFPATDGDGESTATLTSDYVTGVGEAIEVRIPLSDGDVAVTVTTT
jgi:hypothetical protein